MKIFVNNVDGFLAGAMCADLYKISHHIVGTRKGRQDDLVPPMVKRIVPRVEVRRLLKAVAACDVVIYDLHDADLEELELVLRALQISEIHHRMTFILISSVGVWARTQRGCEEVPTVQAEVAEAEGEGEVAEAEGEGEAAAEAEAGEGEGEAAGASAADTAAAVPDAPPQMRPIALRSEDYTRRVPAPKFQEWKAIETQVLSLKEKATIRPYVVCAGVPYGNGEDAFLGLFKAAWQTRDSLRVIGEGKNYIPMVHSRDAARLVRHVIEVGPTLDYHLAVDRGDCTQKALITSVAKQYSLSYEPQSVTVVEALLAELADILTMDLRLEPSALMQVEMPEPPPQAPEGEAEGEAGAGYPADAEADGLAEEAKPEDDEEEEKEEEEEPDINVMPPFRWWCEKGIVANLPQVSAEFTRWRRLQPVRICVTGPPGSGVSNVSQQLAELYNVPAVQLEELVEEQRNLETPLGQQVREQLEAIQANLGNPKSQGPFALTAALTSQLLDHALDTKPGVHRGYILGGFPQTLEEATSAFIEEPVAEEAPPDKKDKKDKKDKAAEEVVPEEPPVVKDAYKLGMAVIISSSDEACLARAQASDEKPYVEKEFQVAMERWKKDVEAFPEFFEKMDVSVCQVSADSAAEAVQQKHEEAVKAAEEEEKDPPEAPDPADLLALATGSYAWVEDALMNSTACLEGRRPVFNFKPSPAAITAEIVMKPQSEQVTGVDENAAAEAAAAAAAAKEAEKRAEKARQELQRVEQVKKEELARLEKHSEPLRLYLMKFVVPALTGALVDVCREQPDDPAGYLAEYLQVYSEVAKQRERERGLEMERAAAAAVAADPKQG